MLQNLTGVHALLILAVIVLIFGAAKLPALARSIGQSVRILKDESRTEAADALAPDSLAQTEASDASAPALATVPAPPTTAVTIAAAPATPERLAS